MATTSRKERLAAYPAAPVIMAFLPWSLPLAIVEYTKIDEKTRCEPVGPRRKGSRGEGQGDKRGPKRKGTNENICPLPVVGKRWLIQGRLIQGRLIQGRLIQGRLIQGRLSSQVT